MKNRESFINEISSIRSLLSENNIMGAYDKMISLNEYDDRVDDYTCYFLNTFTDNIDYSIIEGATEEQLEDGIVIVEGALSGYVVAQASDIEETLKEIEENLL